MTIYIILIWFIGVIVARWQLGYWFRDRILFAIDYDVLMFFSILSWAIYPIYLFEWLMNKLKDR